MAPASSNLCITNGEELGIRFDGGEVEARLTVDVALSGESGIEWETRFETFRRIDMSTVVEPHFRSNS